MPRWEISQPGNVLRVFERGGKRRLEVGLPDKEEEPGKPDKGLSPRGFGTEQRTDPVFLGITEDTTAGSDAQSFWAPTIIPAIIVHPVVPRVT